MLSTGVALIAWICSLEGTPHNDGFGGNKGNVGNWGTQAKALGNLLCKR